MGSLQEKMGAAAGLLSLLDTLEGKSILVTGGTGSFGATFVDLCLGSRASSSVTVYSRDEQKHVHLRRTVDDTRLRTILGDVRDLDRLRMAMRGIDIVFNAAAIKHVHLSEAHPIEAVRTNVLGAFNVCQAAVECNVEVVVNLSTDKSVAPVNVMGMSKALQERIMTSFAGGATRFGVVRYGNVLASNGSVIPYFKKLLEDGAEVLPVTDRRMTRFVLTLRDSVALVLYAAKHCRDGEIYVLDLPAFRIWDVAQVMAQAVSSKGRAVGIQETGIRPGEKLHETLISEEEMRRCEDLAGIRVIRPYRSPDERFPPSLQESCLSSDRAVCLNCEEILELLSRENCLPMG